METLSILNDGEQEFTDELVATVANENIRRIGDGDRDKRYQPLMLIDPDSRQPCHELSEPATDPLNQAMLQRVYQSIGVDPRRSQLSSREFHDIAERLAMHTDAHGNRICEQLLVDGEYQAFTVTVVYLDHSRT